MDLLAVGDRIVYRGIPVVVRSSGIFGTLVIYPCGTPRIISTHELTGEQFPACRAYAGRGRWACDVGQCNFTSLTERGRNVHIAMTHVLGEFPCPKCDYHTTTQQGLWLHNRKMHVKPNGIDFYINPFMRNRWETSCNLPPFS